MKQDLPHDLIKQSFDGDEQTLRLYLQCVGCGKCAILILTRKPRRATTAEEKAKKQATISTQTKTDFVHTVSYTCTKLTQR